MSPEERFAILETNQKTVLAWMEKMDKKVDRLVSIADMGKGALWLAIKVGVIAAVIVSAIAYVYERVRH